MDDSINIRYYQVANVQATAAQLDEIVQHCSIWGDGNENICTTGEDIFNALLEGFFTHEVKQWLQAVLLSITNNKTDNVVFHK